MATDLAQNVPSPMKDRRGKLVQQTRNEHDALLAAIHQMEEALERASTWDQEVVQKLRTVVDTLAEHAASADGPEGLLAEIDVTWPTLVHRVAELRKEHTNLLEQARALQRQVELNGKNDRASFQDIRQQGALLLKALRDHQAAEDDLIFESCCTEVGVGD